MSLITRLLNLTWLTRNGWTGGYRYDSSLGALLVFLEYWPTDMGVLASESIAEIPVSTIGSEAAITDHNFALYFGAL